MDSQIDSAFQVGNMLVNTIFPSISVLNTSTVSCGRQGKDRIMPVIEMKWEFETIKGFGRITISALMKFIISL